MAPVEAFAVKCPSSTIALSNRVAVPPELLPSGTKHVTLRRSGGGVYHFSVEVTDDMRAGEIGISTPARKWAEIAVKDRVILEPSNVSECVGTVEITIDFFKKGTASKERYDSDALASEIISSFANTIVTCGQSFALEFKSKKAPKPMMFLLKVEKMTGSNLAAALGKGGAPTGEGPIDVGLVFSQTVVHLSPAEDGAGVSLGGKATRGGGARSVINPDWNFKEMGIGGLDNEFSTMFRRAFASRVMPVEFMEKLGMQHVKGILLHGPPGTGKTLMARQIGKMLNGTEPKIVSGPEILSKFVGESEKNIRELFEDAEKEYKSRGENSSLHVIIFDEIDAICKQRGSHSSGTGVNDSIVNQLLAKIDGVESLNNILLIGMTNRLDMIDEALTRPGRLELKMPIGLPDESGRKDIFQIHTSKMRENKVLSSDVDLGVLARDSKNFSGAEIAGLCRSAVSFATNRCVTTEGKVHIDEKLLSELKVDMGDFSNAIEEVIPAFGVTQEEFEGCYLNGIVDWGPCVSRVLKDGNLFSKQVKNSDRTPLVSLLLEGAAGTGKTALASKLAVASDFPLIKMISPETMVGQTELTKVSKIKKIFEDAYKSTHSVIVIDDIERLMDYVPVGQRFSNTVLQALMVLLKKKPPAGRKLLIIATSSAKDVLGMMGMVDSFSSVMHVDAMSSGEEIEKILSDVDAFTALEMEEIRAAFIKDGSTMRIDSLGAEAHICIGVKKLYMLVEMARQEVEGRAAKFLYSLYEECRYSTVADM